MIGGPFAHQMIRASAGSGKTHRLTNRYLALLAAGIEPDAILATTFTRKAAGEILDRILYRLAEAASNTETAKQLTEQVDPTRKKPQDLVPLLRHMVRSLHRVRIGTLDSFFIALAGSFSMELGLPAGWSIGEPADEDALREEALERLLENEQADILIALYQRLTTGQTKRGVREELVRIVTDLYDTCRETEPDAWSKVTVPQPLLLPELDSLLAQIEAFDLSKYSRMQKPRAEDAQRARSEDWTGLLAKGLCGKVVCGENAFYSKAIPDELVDLYDKLIQHARSVLIAPLAEQTQATREFLDRFHRELWALKRATGRLRFGDVTQTLVDALRHEVLRVQELAFRLDGAVEHLLLDEFQDTSLAQWRVLEPIARAITHAPTGPARSFFCVGDVKQAIYGWRGGMAKISENLPQSLGKLDEVPLIESRRSAQPIIDVVNAVFTNLARFDPGDKCRAGVAAWGRRFEPHTSVKNQAPGHVCVETGPAQPDGQGINGQRRRHCEHVAKRIHQLHQHMPSGSIGVLCRKNETVARMIYELHQLHVEASEEGGNPLTDSAAVELVLSLFTLTDHPGHSAAWFHLLNSPMQKHLESLFADPDTLAHYLRRELVTAGYGPFTYAWAQHLAPACDQRDLNRLQQLVEMAYGYQARSTLRTDDFVAWVRQQRVPDPLAAGVRVMTIHAAKGLEFDAVVLPELDVGLTGQAPAFVVGRDSESLDVTFVCRYANDDVQKLLTDEERGAFECDRRQQVEESLSLLYVAMTRAIHALYLFIPGPRKANRRDAWYNLLRQTLAPDKAASECSPVFEHGQANWFHGLKSEPAPKPRSEAEVPKPIIFRAGSTEHRRGLDHVAPSRREGQGRIALDRLFQPSEGTGMAAGTLYHAWFETITWLNDGAPTDAVLRAAAEKRRNDLPAEVWRDLDRLLANFRAWLQNPEISAVLQRSAYADPQEAGFPAALAPFWTKTVRPQTVEQERRFLIREGTTFWNGSLDRVVWLGDGDRTVAADVLDFKTDDIAPGDAAALAARTEHYRPQLEAYRRAVARLAQIPTERVATRLVFTWARRLVQL
jgi:ATP-dependent exoDNAse (exonuclease V) beta subunit